VRKPTERGSAASTLSSLGGLVRSMSRADVPMDYERALAMIAANAAAAAENGEESQEH
jgi:hypothetical protein